MRDKPRNKPAAAEGGTGIEPRSSIAVVVLAAGAARRFGSPKQLIPWRGEALVVRAVRQASGSRGLGPWVVLGSHADEVAHALAPLDFLAVRNHHWQDGQGTSIAAAVRALPPAIAGAIFLPCDQPFVDSSLLDRLIAAHASATGMSGRPAIFVPVVDGRRTSPVLFDRELFGELMALDGEKGGRQLFPQHADRILEVEIHDPKVARDIDTLDDLEKCRRIDGS